MNRCVTRSLYDPPSCSMRAGGKDQLPCGTSPCDRDCRASTWRNVAIQEVVDQRRHNVQLVFQREMTGVEKVKFGIRQVSKIWPCAISREYLVVLSPHDQRGRLVFTEKGLEFRIEWNVSAVIVEQI
jgi:hypothetical protein